MKRCTESTCLVVAEMSDTTKRKRFEIFLWLCLIVVFTTASYVIFHEYRFSLNSDGAAADILAKLAVNEGSLVPKNWTYANGDLWILGPRLFLVILFPWVGLGYLLHASSIWLGYLYLLVMIYGACRVIAPFRRRAAIIATALAAGGLSTLNFEFVIGQGAYSLYAAMALALFGLASRTPEAETPWRSHVITLPLAASAAVLVCIGNATRGSITVIMPLIVGWIVAALLHSSKPWRQRLNNLVNPVILSIIAGAIIGILIYQLWLLPGVINSAGAASFKLTPASEMVHRLLLLPSAWFTYFRIGGAWASLPFVSRIIQSFVWLVAAGLLVAPIAIVFSMRQHSQSLVIMSWVALACYGVTFVALVASQNLFDGPASMRYATFAIYAAVCVLAIQADKMVDRRPKIAISLITVLCLISIATISIWRAEWTAGGITYAQREALIHSLEEHKVDAVLATYWNAEVLTVLSNGHINALPVYENKTTGLQRYAQNSPRIVLPPAPQSRQAIALTESEDSPAIWNLLNMELGNPTESYRSGPFSVGVYDRDIVKQFYGKESAVDAAVPSNQLMVRLSHAYFPACQSKPSCTFSVEATNVGQHTLVTGGTKPLRLGIHGIDAKGQVIEWDTGRADFPLPLYPGDSERIEFKLPAVRDPKILSYRLCLLQELVAWHCNRTEAQTPVKAK